MEDNRQPDTPTATDKFNKLSNIFGQGRLVRLMHTRSHLLQGFLAGEQPLGSRYAARLDFLYEVVHDLEGSYNAFGINRWFERPRVQLGRHAPNDLLLNQAWRVEHRDVRRIRKLAKDNAASPSI